MPQNFSAMIGAIFLALSVGCNSIVPSEPLSPSAIQSTTPSPSPTLPVSKVPLYSPGASTLTLWTTEDYSPGASASGEIWREQLASFRATNPNIILDIVLKKTDGKGGLFDSLLTTRAAVPTLLPDVVILNANDIPVASDAKILQPLDGLAFDEFKDDLFPFAQQLSTYKNQWVAIPFASDVQQLVYNQAAISPAPRTWDELGRQKSSLLLPLAGDDGFLLQYLSLGGSLNNFDAVTATQVFSFIKRGHDGGYVSDASLTLNTADDTWSGFASGQVAMAQVTASRYIAWRDKLPSGLNAAFASVPTRDGKTTSLASAWAFAIVTNDPGRKSAAVTLIRWMIKSERLILFLRAAHRLPTYRAMLTGTIDSKEYAAFLRDLMEGAVPMPSRVQNARQAEAWRSGITSVWRGQLSPEDAAKNVAAVK